jgi:hypothetical protein
LAVNCAIALDLGLDGTGLELGDRVGHVKEELTCGGGGVEVLLIEVEIDADRFEVLDRAQEIDGERA